ncbi:TPA: hypothetical protein U0Z67_000823 [Legionella pneumophila]|nr:hypothetical protein [Legionella pneumophila]
MSIKQNYFDQFLDLILGKGSNEKELISSLSLEPIWDERLRYSFAQIIEINSLTSEETNALIRPKYRVDLLEKLYKKIDWKKEIARAKYLLKSSSYEESKKEALEIFLGINRKRGEPYNIKYLSQYATHSLFYIASQIGLKRRDIPGEPYQAHQYIDAIIKKGYRERNKLAYSYRENNLLKKFYENRNVLHRFIFDPYCKETQKLLRTLRLRRIFQSK